MKTKELITAYYSAFNRNDMDSFLSLLTADVRHDINQGKRESGKDAFRDFMAIMNEHYEEKAVDIVVMASDDGRRASAEFYIEGVYKKTQKGLPPAKGQKYRLPVGAFFEVIEGKISRVTNYYNLQDWIDQVSK